ncbi:FG-GAP-like repeat-containing protein [Emticicia sp. 21SJ11W-3]|uniref:FG-GAP-like repeat-containing protein n=1 Tax=Emticicia sp. 21SJ11W-3 TaxID=2916755 RepID=UPI0020A18664|nr:FG-GAP-like repeat-containing protein [Emticicia sp. 21SJ11W-3]UTA68516.1 FG-GAP-like repeat-containing protein [Emticicia sp. 21SJ11W-3]
MKTLLFCVLSIQLCFAQAPNFIPQIIDNQVSIGYGLAIGDVDGDKRSDILMADQKQFVWYRNGDWKRFVMIENLTARDNVCIAARDIDGDGKVEVAVGANWNPAETKDPIKSGSVHYLIRPVDPTQKWEAVELHHEVTIHRMKWVKAKNKYQLVVVPLHGLGNRNGEGAGVKIWAYEVPKNVKSEWKRTLIDSTMHLTHNFEVTEEKTTTYLTIGGKEGLRTYQYTNKWEKAGKEHKNMMIGELKYAEVNKNGYFATVQPMHGNKLVWVSNNREPQVLTENLNQGHALALADFLNLGRPQIAVGWREPNKDKKVGIQFYIPDATFTQWTEHIIDDNTMACEDMQCADMDGDGRLDIIAAGRASKNLIIYWNK